MKYERKYCFTADQQIPWLGAGVGIILGVIVVIADYVFTNKPTLTVLIDALRFYIIIER
jgi:flagellar biosynthesis/type III secretory pathway M-ring protein FliF/YscJ